MAYQPNGREAKMPYQSVHVGRDASFVVPSCGSVRVAATTHVWGNHPKMCR